MAGIQRDVLINYKGDASNLTAASQKAQDAVDSVTEASVSGSEAAAKAAEKAAKAQEDTAKATKAGAKDQASSLDDLIDTINESGNAHADNAERAADGFGKVGESAGKLGGVLEMLGLEGASTVADLADAGEVAAETFGALSATVGGVGAVLATVGAVVATVGGALYVLNQTVSSSAAEFESSAAAAELLATSLDEVAASQANTQAALRDATLQVGLLTGQVEEYEVAAFAAADKARQGAEAELGARARVLSAIRQQIVAINQKIEAGDLDARQMANAFTQLNDLAGKEEEAASAVRALKDETNAKANAVFDATLKDGAAQKAAERKAAAEQAASEAARIHEERIRATNDALTESIRLMGEDTATTQQYSATLAQIAQITSDYQTSLLTGQDAIEAARAKEQASLLAIYQQTVALAQSNAELAAANEAYTSARASVDAKYAAQSATYADEQAAKLAENHAYALELQAQGTDGLAEALEYRAQLWQGFYDGYVATYLDAAMQVADLAGQFAEEEYQQHADALDRLQERRDALTEQQKENTQAAQEATDAQTRSELEAANAILAAKKDALREQAKEERQQAMKAFRINQAIQIAQSVAGAALAVLNAFATVPYPASIAAAAAATATGAATIATVAAQKPQFHQGGIVQANVLPGEGVANRDLVRAVGEQTFNAMNRDPAGAAAALSGGGTTLIIGRQAFGEIGRNLLVGRTPVAQAINSRARPGQVALGTSNLPVLS